MALIKLNNNSISAVTELPAGISEQNYPAFHAYLSSTQALTDATNTKIQFDTEVFDTDGYYDNSTDYRFTPLVAGKYLVNLTVSMQVNGTDQLNFAFTLLYKNGSALYTSGTDSRGTYKLSYSHTRSVSVIVDMNGTTDYLEGYANCDDNVGSPDAQAVVTGSRRSHFEAFRIGD